MQELQNHRTVILPRRKIQTLNTEQRIQKMARVKKSCRKASGKIFIRMPILRVCCSKLLLGEDCLSEANEVDERSVLICTNWDVLLLLNFQDIFRSFYGPCLERHAAWRAKPNDPFRTNSNTLGVEPTISHYWRRLYASRIFRICWSLKFEFSLFSTWAPFVYYPASSDSFLLSGYSRKMLNLFPEVCNSRVCITNDDRSWCGTNWFYQVNTGIKTCQSHVFQAGISYIAFRSLELQLPEEPASWTAMTRQGAHAHWSVVSTMLWERRHVEDDMFGVAASGLTDLTLILVLLHSRQNFWCEHSALRSAVACSSRIIGVRPWVKTDAISAEESAMYSLNHLESKTRTNCRLVHDCKCVFLIFPAWALQWFYRPRVKRCEERACH